MEKVWGDKMRSRSAAIDSMLPATITGKDRVGGDSGSNEPASPISVQIGQRSPPFFGELGAGADGRRSADRSAAGNCAAKRKLPQNFGIES